MERLSRIVVFASLLAAGLAYAWLLAPVMPALPLAAAAAFAVSFGLAKLSLPLGLAPALALAYVAPALLMVVFGSPDHHQGLVWLSLMAGPLLALGDWRRWRLPSAWKWPVAAWALVVALTWPVIAGREVDFSLVAARSFDTPNGLLAGPPPLAAAWVISVAMGQIVGLLWLDLLWARFGAERLRRAKLVVFLPLLLSVSLSALAGIYQEYVDIHWLNVGTWPNLDRAGGLMLDANSFGTAAAMWAPATVLLAWRLGRSMAAGLVVMGLLSAGVWTSGSRTAFLILLAGLVALVAAWTRRTRAWQARLAPLALLLAAAAVIVVAAVQSDDPTNPLARLLATAPRDEAGAGAAAMEFLWTRNGYGTAAMHAIDEHPWVGLGVGAFNLLSSDYSYLATGAVIPPDNAQNWWRHQVAELGWLGALPSLVFSLVLLLTLVRARPADGQRDAGTVVRGVLVGTGLASLVGLSTQHPALLLTFVTFVYWFGAVTMAASRPATATPRAGWPSWAVVFAFGGAIAIAQLADARGILRVPARALRAGFPYAYGFSTPASDPRLGEFRWAGRHAVAVMRAEHAYFAITTVTPHEDAARDPVRVRITQGSRLVADMASRSSEPITHVLQVPRGERFLMIESEVSRAVSEGKALQVAGRWMREAPSSAPPVRPFPGR